MKSRYQSGLRPLAADYDLFLIDQYGVIHDGAKPYPDAIACLEQLMAAGKTVIILTNSGKRAEANEHRLGRLGFPRASYSQVVSSGEVAHQYLRDRDKPGRESMPKSRRADAEREFFRTLGTRCLLISTGDDRSVLAGLPIQEVSRVADADFILLAGMDESQPDEYYDALLAEAWPRRLPLICANPDETRITPDGLKPGSGLVAQRYEQRGGPTCFLGKPYPAIYRYALRLLPEVPQARILAIGDSLKHDIAGAAGVGIAGALIAGGIHAAGLAGVDDNALLTERLATLGVPPGPAPTWVLPTLSWG